MRRPISPFRALGTSLTLLLAALLVLPAAPAQAGTTLLCKGFTDCSRKGYSNYGYAAVYRQMHWRMYGGHNCTNYAAYRMIKAGGPATRPWSGGGNASNWGIALASKTDRIPTVGSVAWWRNRNHVQIVERVIDANTLVISEDHWGGDFDWAVVRRSSGHWPDGFIHIVDAPLAPSVQPSLSPNAQVGVPTTVSPGVWPAGTTVTYQWLAGGYPIAGATSRTYVPRPEDVGKWLIVRVVANKPGHRQALAYPPRTLPTKPGVMESGGDPVVSGFVKVGGTLTAQDPQLSPAPEQVARQWLADGAPVAGGTTTTLRLTPDLEGKRLAYRYTGVRRGYTTVVAHSQPTAAVGPEQMVLTARPRLTGRSFHGERLTLEPGATNVPGARMVFRWYSGGVMRPEVTSPRYLLGAADLGKRVSVKVAWRKPGYPEVVSDLASYVVRSRPQPRILSSSGRSILLELRAPGNPVVDGRATITLRTGQVFTARVADGRARFTGFPLGWRQVSIGYTGNRFTTPGTWGARVEVRR